jgi:hypothetical protein
MPKIDEYDTKELMDAAMELRELASKFDYLLTFVPQKANETKDLRLIAERLVNIAKSKKSESLLRSARHQF